MNKIPQTKGTLEAMLIWGKEEEMKCIEILKLLPPEVKEEYDLVLDRLGKAQAMLLQVRRQIAARK